MHDASSQQAPFFLRVIVCLFFAVLCFFLGLGVYYVNSFRSFLSVSTGQSVHLITNPTTTLTPISGQTNILLLGSDNDQKFTGNPLTQTMMIIHIDTNQHEVDMFSIPRDLWVRMPGMQKYGKIDQAAEYQGIPSAIQVVEQTFGIPIDHYAWIGLYGFIKSINTLGGINLQVIHPVLDEQYPTDITGNNPYGYQRLDIQPGMQHMTGEQALQYVRSRHEDLIGDFGRTQRQRQLLLAVKELLLSSPDFIASAPQLFDSLQGQIKTDITPSIAGQLGLFFLTNKNSLTPKQYTLSLSTYSNIGNSTDGQSIVIADATASAQLVSQIFGPQAGQITLVSLSSEQGIAP